MRTRKTVALFRDLVDHPALPDHLADLETKEVQETQAKSVLANPAQLVHREPTANPALEALLANPARQAKMALQVPLALPEMLELEVRPSFLNGILRFMTPDFCFRRSRKGWSSWPTWRWRQSRSTRKLRTLPASSFGSRILNIYKNGWSPSTARSVTKSFPVFQSLLFFFSFHVRKIRDSHLSLLLHLKRCF